ncbi:MAG: hypothetical protein ACTS2F_22265 [Thainema sp.]
MESQGKFVVIVFPHGLQGKIWSTILRSQSLSVIWESPDVSLPRTLKTLHEQNSVPDLLIIDTRLRHLQPFHICRWCQAYCPEVNVLLVNGAQPRILATERQWAIAQGAADLLPRICQDALISNAAANLRCALDLLSIQPFEQQEFISTLLKMGLKSQSHSFNQRKTHLRSQLISQ